MTEARRASIDVITRTGQRRHVRRDEIGATRVGMLGQPATKANLKWQPYQFFG